MKRRELFLERYVPRQYLQTREGRESLIAMASAAIARETADNMQDMFFQIRSCLEAMNLGKLTTYKIAERFGEHLDRTNLKVPARYLPKRLGIWIIEFPENTRHYFAGAKVRTGIYVFDPQSSDHEKPLSGMSIYSDGPSFTFSIKEPSDDDVLEDMFIPNSSGWSNGIDRDAAAGAVGFVTKCLLYINSAEPDLKPVPYVAPTTEKKKKLRRFWEENYSYDVINVGYDFHGKHRHVDSTSVRGHFRWQPCGPQFSQVKLIWIDEHERKFHTVQSIGGMDDSQIGN